ncbi:MAG: bifunctional diguanylate cyclase/phosphodiesterase [Pontibacterium sp.]
MTAPYDAIDFRHYHRLSHQQLPQLICWGVVDNHSKIIYCSCDQSHAALLQHSNHSEAHNRHIPPARDKKAQLICHALMSDDANNHAQLRFLLKPGSAEVQKATQLIADSLNQELQLHQELNTMATELLERYEELNLLYDTDQQNDLYIEGQKALSQLVLNCVDYLNVEYAQLWLPGQKIQLVHSRANSTLTDCQSLSKLARTRLWEQMIHTPSAIVINSPAELHHWQLDYFPACKLLAVPVINGNRHIIGFLLLANPASAADFLNSDRNLIEVMSRRVSKQLNNNFDDLTGLIKRNGFEYYLNRALESSHNKGLQHCLLLLDLDQFHIINDTLDYQTGDQVLRDISEILQRETRDSDTLPRLASDTFGLLLENCPAAQGHKIAGHLVEIIQGLRIGPPDNELTLSCSAGLYPLDDNSESTELLMSRTEVSVKLAKELGGNRVQTWSNDNQDLASRTSEIHWISRIQTAVREDLFIPYVQPIVPLNPHADQACHGEVLLRLMDKGQVIPPIKFLPAAEHYHLMPMIDEWVIRQTLAKIKTARQGVWSINLSGQSLARPEFLGIIQALISESGVDPARLCFEVTETTAIGELKKARQIISTLRNLGCRFSLDDFGTGLSSFTYLQELPVDYLKIDGSFVRNIDTDPVAYTMVSAIHQVSKAMGLQTIAEYVENEAIRDRLITIGIDFAQGYYYGKPAPLQEVSD